MTPLPPMRRLSKIELTTPLRPFHCLFRRRRPDTETAYFANLKIGQGISIRPKHPLPNSSMVLHFTAGNLSGGMSALTTQDRRVSTAFVLARDGTIYQLFSSKYWSGHIGAGIGNTGTNNAQDKVR
jgi:N-acetyl-anhydromuramyl-L-alanine amidase AmpD